MHVARIPHHCRLSVLAAGGMQLSVLLGDESMIEASGRVLVTGLVQVLGLEYITRLLRDCLSD